ncbi:MAG: type II toxin-antitoxin system VapC family toxin [Deltaproteobacteria bacterium]|nr:type II toxin-antitoxin system VapC family toxin [Deltaproteobacteria bacterium]
MNASHELCVDANVFVAALIKRERHHQVAVQLINVLLENEIPLFEPEVVLFEVGTAFYRKRAEGAVSDEEMADALDLFFQYPMIFEWQSEIVRNAVRLSLRLSYRGIADCCYLALAQKRNIPLITFDEKLIARGRIFYRKISTPSEFLQLTPQ